MNRRHPSRRWRPWLAACPLEALLSLQSCRVLPARLILIPAVVAAAACGDAEAPRGGDWEVERATVDGVEVVRTLSGSVWGEPVELVEELAIGTLEGADAYMFGRIDHVAADGNGGVYVFDGQVPALRHYDAEGRYVRTFGRPGSGPGEYRDAALGLARLADGRVLLRDPRNFRFNVYAPDGTALDHWPLPSGLFTSRATYVDTTGHVYARILTGAIEPNTPWPIGLQRISPTGALLDTIPAPVMSAEAAGAGMPAATTMWDLHRNGWFVVGVNDRYALELRRPEGTLRIEKAGERLALHSEERAELEAARAHVIRTQGQFMTSEPPPTPQLKPAFRGIYTGDDGTIWVHVPQHAVYREPPADAAPRDPDAAPVRTWIEPLAFDVYEADGTYLGLVRVPPRTALRTYSLGHVWGTRRGDFDETYLVRLRLDAPVR